MNFLNYSPPQFQRVFEALGVTLLHSLWQGFLLMLLLWALLRFIRYEKANLRFVFAFATLMLLLLAFGATFYYEWDSLKPLAPVAQSFNSETIPLTDLEVSGKTTVWEQIKGEVYTIFYQLTESARLLAIAWLVGSLLFSFRLSLGLWQIHQLKKERQPLPELWQAKISALQKVLNIHRHVEISLNPDLDSPLTLGWLRPMVLFPASMLMAMPADQVESILVHELAHIRRHDYLWNLLQSVAEVILFYHPAYWYIASVLEQEREHACDLITLKITGRPQIYAQALLQVATLSTTLSTVGLSAKGRGRGRSGFAERIKRIVAPNQKKKGVQPLPFLLSFCLLGFLLFAFTLKSQLEAQTGPLNQETTISSYDSLRTPDYVDYRYRIFDDKTLPEMLAYSSMNDKNYIIGQAKSGDDPINVREYFDKSALFLLDGEIVDDPEQILMSDISRYEVYHEPLPTSLEKLSTRPYSSVVSASTQIPTAISESSHIKVGGQVHTKENDRLLPAIGVMVEVKSSGQQTSTDAQGRFLFASVAKDDTLLFYTPSVSGKPTSVPVEGREHLGLYTHVPHVLQRAEKLKKRMSKHMLPEMLEKDRKAIDERISLSDSSIYDVIEEKILIDPKTNTVRFKSDVPASQDEPNTYYSIRDPEVLFTLDGVVTDPRTIDRRLIDGASFETQDVPDGYLVEIKAVSKEVAEAAKKESQKTIVRGRVTDQKTGKPLPGTNILVKGTTIGTVSNLEGSYQIEVPNGNGELVFAFVGYEIKTETIKNSKILEIEMSPLPAKEELLEKKIAKGRVLDATTNEPLAGVEVYSMKDGARIEGIYTYTNQNGEYQFAVPADFKVLVHAKEGYPDHLVPIRYLTGDKAENWEIVMKKLPQVNKKADTRSNPLIQGQVVDAETGQGIPGVNVLISGTTTGTVTDMEGQYQIKLTEDAKNLSFSAIGYQNKQLTVTGAGKLDTKLLSSDAATGKAQDNADSILFIIDDIVRNDIKSFKELDEKYPINTPYNISIKGGAIDPSMVPSMSPALLKQFNRLVIINTSKTYDPSDIESRIQGKVVDEKTGAPLEGVEITDLKSKQVLAVSDQDGEYVFTLKQPEEKIFLQYQKNGYSRYVLPACSDCYLSPTSPSVLVLPMKPEEETDKHAFEDQLKVFPNPGNDEIKVNFTLAEAASVAFELLDKEGNLLHEVDYHYDTSGAHEVMIPSDNFPPDTYLLRIKHNDESVVRRVILK